MSFGWPASASGRGVRSLPCDSVPLATALFRRGRGRKSRSLGTRKEPHSAGVAAKAISGIASCGAVRSSELAGARLSPKRKTATIT